MNRLFPLPESCGAHARLFTGSAGSQTREALEGLDYLRREPAELLMVRRRQARDQRLAFLGEGEVDLAPILLRDLADYRLAQDELIDDADSAMMPHLQLLREFADGKPAWGGGGSDGKKRLILIRGEVLRAQQVFAETEEFPNLIAEGSKCLKIDRVQVYGVRRYTYTSAWQVDCKRYWRFS